MKRFEFRQVSKGKLKLFIMAYLVFFLSVILYVILGPNEILNFINSTSSTFIGLLAGLIFISPLLLKNKLTSHSISITFDEEMLIVQEKEKKTAIKYSSIDKMCLSRTRIGELELFNYRSNLLYAFMASNDGAIIEKIIALIRQKVEFRKTSEIIKRRVGSYPIITYKR